MDRAGGGAVGSQHLGLPDDHPDKAAGAQVTRTSS